MPIDSYPSVSNKYMNVACAACEHDADSALHLAVTL